MKKMGLNEIREKYLAFFEKKGHLRLESFSLVPKDDQSILLINAGMTPLKPYFTGALTPPAPRVTTCQKCIRTPDIDRVGKTSRHGTFFEMLGNFSFGDYFKEEAIKWAWEFCIEVLELPCEKLFVSVYENDDEAYDIWNKKVGIAKNKIFKLGKEDNFWEHGTGPCGPCSEIFFDRGEKEGCDNPECNVGCDCDRYVEFWNLVFTQFNKEKDGSYTPLEDKNIDTGGGLERFACIMQDVDNLFEVDTIKSVLEYVCEITDTSYGKNKSDDVAIRVITDHARSAVMMISDDIIPDNTSRGYVLRRIIRRAARFGRMLGKQNPFLHDVATVVIDQSAEAYPELREKREYIVKVILKEEESFAGTVKQGMSILNEYIDKVKSEKENTLTGEMVFKLHDTFGFPIELTEEIASENSCEIDREGFFKHMEKQKENARSVAFKNKEKAAWSSSNIPKELSDIEKTEFVGYEKTRCESHIKALVGQDNGKPLCIDSAKEGDEVIVVSPKTPFYAEAGGQTGDVGIIEGANFKLDVTDTKKTSEGVYLHFCKVVSGTVNGKSEIKLSVNRERRLATARNHTSTHLLHKALRKVLGNHVLQAGSDVSPERLRFDFSHFSALTEEEKKRVENEVNEQILADRKVTTRITDIEAAKNDGALALFDEKYEGDVRVVSVGDYSKELCGGTHLETSSQACIFKILSESSVAAGVRRIEACTGRGALELVFAHEKMLKKSAEYARTDISDLPEKVSGMSDRIKSLEKELEKKTKELAKNIACEILENAIEKYGLKLLFADVETQSTDELRKYADYVKDKLGQGVVFLASEQNGKAVFVAMATKEAVKKGAHAGKIAGEAAKTASGGGGGRPDMAQAGGKDPSKIKDAVNKAMEICMRQLEGVEKNG